MPCGALVHDAAGTALTITGLYKTIDHDCRGNTKYACDRDLDRQTEGNTQDTEIQDQGGRQTKRLSIIQPRTWKKVPDEAAYDDPCQNKQKTSPIILTHMTQVLLSQRSFYHNRFFMYTKIGKKYIKS